MEPTSANDFSLLAALGWKPVYLQDVTLEELDQYTIGRVISVDRGRYHVKTSHFAGMVQLPGRWRHATTAAMQFPTTGDWVLLNGVDGAAATIFRLLQRITLLQRTAPGQEHRASVQRQLLCANADTAFIVSALDGTLSVRGIERYLSLLQGSGVQPVVVLTKADLHEHPQNVAQDLAARLALDAVVAIDGTCDEARQILQPWLIATDTIALLGPSGVGKSTLTNTMVGSAVQMTQATRESDAKGRHTTTRRSLVQLSNDVCIIDTPGMRELRLANEESSIDESFQDITQLALECRFSDCSHASEPGCAVMAAIGKGTLSEDRWNSFLGLRNDARVQARLAAAEHVRRERDRGFGKMYKAMIGEKEKRRRS